MYVRKNRGDAEEEKPLQGLVKEGCPRPDQGLAATVGVIIGAQVAPLFVFFLPLPRPFSWGGGTHTHIHVYIRFLSLLFPSPLQNVILLIANLHMCAAAVLASD